MPRRHLRSRSRKRSVLRLPGGRVTTHYKRKRYSQARCANCGLPLRGVPTTSLKSVSKTSRKPTRALGGVVCAICLKEAVRERARAG